MLRRVIVVLNLALLLQAGAMQSRAFGEEYLVRIDFVAIECDGRLGVDERNTTETARVIEMKLESGTTFSQDREAHGHTLKAQGRFEELLDNRVRISDYVLRDRCGNDAWLQSGDVERRVGHVSCIARRSNVSTFADGSHQTLFSRIFLTVVRWPRDPAERSRLTASLERCRDTIMREEVQAHLADEAAEREAVATILAAARKHAASGKARVAERLLGMVRRHSIEGTAPNEVKEIQRAIDREFPDTPPLSSRPLEGFAP